MPDCVGYYCGNTDPAEMGLCQDCLDYFNLVTYVLHQTYGFIGAGHKYADIFNTVQAAKITPEDLVGQ